MSQFSGMLEKTLHSFWDSSFTPSSATALLSSLAAFSAASTTCGQKALVTAGNWLHIYAKHANHSLECSYINKLEKQQQQKYQQTAFTLQCF